MKFRDFLEQWGLTTLKLNLGFLEGTLEPRDPDRAAAWDLYVELLTRATTQYLMPDQGDERTALDSVHAMFGLTRDILKKHGSGAGEFAKLAIPVLNQVVRPFTTRWHGPALAHAFENPLQRDNFRADLAALQVQLRRYTRALAAMAGVEDLTVLEVADD